MLRSGQKWRIVNKLRVNLRLYNCHLPIDRKTSWGPDVNRFLNNIFSWSSFGSQKQYTPSALIGSSGHLIPSGLVLFCLEEPIHIPSVLVGLTLRPDSFWKSSRSLKSARAESISGRTAVVSWAYWSDFVSSLSIGIPFIFIYLFCRTATPNTWAAITTRDKEKMVLLVSSLKGKIIWCDTIVYDTSKLPNLNRFVFVTLTSSLINTKLRAFGHWSTGTFGLGGGGERQWPYYHPPPKTMPAWDMLKRTRITVKTKAFTILTSKGNASFQR